MHTLIRATLIPEIVRLIQVNFALSPLEALDKFYTSQTGACLADDQTGLYGQSALYNYSLFATEQAQKTSHPSPKKNKNT